MADALGCVNWRPTPPRSPEREASRWEEVVQAPPAVQPAPVYHTPSAHLWTPPTYVDLVVDDDDTGGHDGDGINGHGRSARAAAVFILFFMFN